jgi:phenylacetate-CoA ligase
MAGCRSTQSMSLKKLAFWLKLPPATRRMATELQRAQTLSSDELASLNWQRRIALVKHCALRVPFYQAKFREIGFEHGDLKSESDFTRLPILERDDVRRHRNALIAMTANRRRMRCVATGGTSGEPLSVFYDSNVPHATMTWRMLSGWGLDISDNGAYLYRAVPTGLRKLLSDIAIYPTRRAYIPAAEMSRARMQRFLTQLKNVKPRYLVGYVGAIDAFADYFLSSGGSLPSLQAVWTTAAPLPEIKRQFFQRVFDCPVYTQYGCIECFMIAAECRRQSGLHLFSDIRHVEIVDADKPAAEQQDGDILVTDLLNYAFPILRYRVGDRGRMLRQNCDCGLNFPILDYVKGRVCDHIYLPDKSFVPGEYWTTIFDDWPDAIKSFQVHQRKDFGIEVRYEPYLESADEAVSAVEKMLRNKLQCPVQLRFIKMKIDNNENGKTRFVKSDIKSQAS